MNKIRSISVLFKALLVLLLGLLMTACGSNSDDDIDQFIKDTSKSLSPKIPAIPQAQPYSPKPYNSDGTLSDPFKSRKSDAKHGGIHPDLKRPKAPLEAYPLESLKFVGLISKPTLRYALIKAPDNTVQQVKLGNFVGQNFGVVTAIREDGITLKEIVQDESSGDWTERSASINAQD
jgi:type IV pilus assembly protein PilP